MLLHDPAVFFVQPGLHCRGKNCLGRVDIFLASTQIVACGGKASVEAPCRRFHQGKMDEFMLQGRFAAGSGKRRVPPAAVWQQHRLEEEPTRLDAVPLVGAACRADLDIGGGGPQAKHDGGMGGERRRIVSKVRGRGCGTEMISPQWLPGNDVLGGKILVGQWLRQTSSVKLRAGGYQGHQCGNCQKNYGSSSVAATVWSRSDGWPHRIPPPLELPRGFSWH